MEMVSIGPPPDKAALMILDSHRCDPRLCGNYNFGSTANDYLGGQQWLARMSIRRPYIDHNLGRYPCTDLP